VGDDPERFWRAFPALIGLFGVLVGAMVTSGVAYLGDRNHRIADDRTARRLVANEVSVDVDKLNGVVAFGRLPTPIETVEWDSNKSTLARYLTDTQWYRVRRFYDALGAEAFQLRGGCVGAVARRAAKGLVEMGNTALKALRLGLPPYLVIVEGPYGRQCL
jgi:hypothetical protein